MISSSLRRNNYSRTGREKDEISKILGERVCLCLLLLLSMKRMWRYIYNEIDDQLSVDEIDRVRIYALIPSTREHEDTPAQLVTSC